MYSRGVMCTVCLVIGLPQPWQGLILQWWTLKQCKWLQKSFTSFGLRQVHLLQMSPQQMTRGPCIGVSSPKQVTCTCCAKKVLWLTLGWDVVGGKSWCSFCTIVFCWPPTLHLWAYPSRPRPFQHVVKISGGHPKLVWPRGAPCSKVYTSAGKHVVKGPPPEGFTILMSELYETEVGYTTWVAKLAAW